MPTPDTTLPKLAYLAHDLADAAVARRIAMLHLGGAEVALAGFLRGATLPADLPRSMGAPLVLGQSRDARLLRRALGVASSLATALPRLARQFDGARALIARNLEMLVIARALQARMTPRPALIYECLDIHRLLLAPGPAGLALRALERRLAPAVDLVVTSSPAFITHHLQRNFARRILLVENKVLSPPAPACLRPVPPPLQIGWFGALRCARSFDLLAALSDALSGQVIVTLRGKPSPAVFPDLAARLAPHPHMRFAGGYAAADLPAIYAQVHLSWCIDFYEEGQNSAWLLPNRLYESAAHGAVPLALAGVETGRFLAARGLGLVLPDADPARLIHILGQMSPARLQDMAARIAAADPALWHAGPADCRALVKALLHTPRPQA